MKKFLSIIAVCLLISLLFVNTGQAKSYKETSQLGEFYKDISEENLRNIIHGCMFSTEIGPSVIGDDFMTFWFHEAWIYSYKFLEHDDGQIEYWPIDQTKDMWKNLKFSQKEEIVNYDPQYTIPAKIVNQLLTRYFNKKMLSERSLSLYFGDYHIDENNATISVRSVGLDPIPEFCNVSEVSSKGNYSILKLHYQYEDDEYITYYVSDLNKYRYVLVNKVKKDDGFWYYPVYTSPYEFTFADAEAALGYKLTPDYLEGIDYDVLAGKSGSADKISYIREFLAANSYEPGGEILSEVKAKLFKDFALFEGKNNSYKVLGDLEFNQDLYLQIDQRQNEIQDYKNFLQDLSLRFAENRSNIINISMAANKDGKYIFSFKDVPSLDYAYYNIRLDQLGITMSLTKADIEKLSAEQCVFEVSKENGNLFITPLSENKISLPTNIKFYMGKVFTGNYLSSGPDLYYVDNTDHSLFIYAKDYGPVEFGPYSATNLSSIASDKFKNVAFNNILSSGILAEDSSNLNLSETLTKGELARICGFILGDIDEYDSTDLPDVKTEDKAYIRAAIKNGIFSYDSGNFNPGEPVKRSTLIYTLTECLKKKGIGLKNPGLPDASALMDFESIQWMKENAQIAIENGIISKDDQALNPNTTVKREHGIITIYRALGALSKNNPWTYQEGSAAELKSNLTNKISKPSSNEMKKIKTHSNKSGIEERWTSKLMENKVLILLFVILILLLVIVLLLIKNRRKNQSTGSGPKVCKTCGKPYKNEKFCTKCGNKLK